MRTLIDGYNLMYARGLLGGRTEPGRLRKVRHRFLNELAAALGPLAAHQTTIVFDAATLPEHAPRQQTHKGLTVVFAEVGETADDRIEHLIRQHSAPKGLTVVSSDHRVRQAASRRKAEALTSDEFLTRLAEPGAATARSQPVAPRLSDEERARTEGLSAQEAEHWLEEFQELAQTPRIQQELKGAIAFPTDEEIAQIEREVERETF